MIHAESLTTAIYGLLKRSEGSRVVFQSPILTIKTTVLSFVKPYNTREVIRGGTRIKCSDLLDSIGIWSDTNFGDKDWRPAEYSDFAEHRTEYRVIGITGRVIVSIDTDKVNP